MKHRLHLVILAITLLSVVLFAREADYFWNLLIAILFISGIVISCGVLFMRLEYFHPARTKNVSKEVILTFDDGPDKMNTPKVLHTLEKHNITAIFFLIGKKMEAAPEMVHRIVQKGHIIGNHTYSHNNLFSMLSKKKVRMEIEQCEALIEKHQKNTQIFRPPVGYTNPTIARVLKESNKQLIAWNLRSYDSIFKNSKKLVQRLVKKVKPGDIVLLHDNLPQTANALENFILEAQKNGIIFAKQDVIKEFIHEK